MSKSRKVKYRNETIKNIITRNTQDKTIRNFGFEIGVSESSLYNWYFGYSEPPTSLLKLILADEKDNDKIVEVMKTIIKEENDNEIHEEE